MFDVVEPRRCARCGAEPVGTVDEHHTRIYGIPVSLGNTTKFTCVGCGYRFFVESRGRTVAMGIAAVLNFAVAVLILQFMGGPKVLWEKDISWPWYYLVASTGVTLYLVPRVALSEIHRLQNPRR